MTKNSLTRGIQIDIEIHKIKFSIDRLMEFSKDKLNSFTAPQTIKFDNMSIVDLATADDFLFIKDAMLTRYTSRLADLQKEFDNL